MTAKNDCPRCGADLHPRVAMNSVSRVDNKTYICTGCGNVEALFNHFWPDKPLPPVTENMNPYAGGS
jgi:ribosomal protein S27AE